MGEVGDIMVPDAYYKNIFDIDYKKLKKLCIKNLFLDVDNTLVPHGAPATKESVELFEKLRSIGFKTCLISNNQKPRVTPFAKAMKTEYIYNAHKPSRKNYRKAFDVMGTKQEETMFVGDQIFTDVFGAKRVGMYSILVKPIHPKEEIQIVLKRYLEKIVLKSYRRYKNKNIKL